jgi:hypothetical protein
MLEMKMKLADYAKLLGFDLRESEPIPGIEELRIVERKEGLANIDDDATVMGIPLRLSEACLFDLEKHADAIVTHEESRVKEQKKHSKNIARTDSREYDRRYKELPQNRIRYNVKSK